jgi:3'-5' exoribonuclease 1
MKYIIVDLEATCWQERKGQKSEIIEIGALCVDDHRQILGEFNQIIKPLVHPVLSDFCTELTSITQEMVDKGLHFVESMNHFLDWINSFEDDYLICSWGFYDKKQFISDCQLHGMSGDWITDQHISLKHQYAQIKSLSRPIGMKSALKTERMQLEGTHHRGIDDARNIAKIFIRFFEYWDREGARKN